MTGQAAIRIWKKRSAWQFLHEVGRGIYREAFGVTTARRPAVG